MPKPFFYHLANVTAAFILLSSGQVIASSTSSNSPDSILWVGDISLGYKNLEFTQHNILEDSSFTASPNFISLNISLTAAYKSAYLSINADNALRKYEETKINFEQADRQEMISYSRKDYNITASYNLNKSFSVFGGYLFGETIVDYTLVEQSDNSPLQGMDLFSEFGLFMGLNYGLSVNKADRLNFNVAYASLSGEYQYSTDSGAGNLVKGDTSGFSFGAKYTRLYYKALYYYFGLKLNRYEFESDNNILDAEENFTIISAGLTKYFL